MKTRALFGRYPRKISLLKDLREGYARACLLRKPMKTGGQVGIPSKISLPKDLAGTFRRKVGLGGRACAGILEIVKDPKEPFPLSNG
jgi:hypothetical protein